MRARDNLGCSQRGRGPPSHIHYPSMAECGGSRERDGECDNSLQALNRQPHGIMHHSCLAFWRAVSTNLGQFVA
jgi:hypothetical protein